MHILYEISIGNLIAIFCTVAGTGGTIVVWFWKYSKNDDQVHERVQVHDKQLEKVTAMCKALIQLVQKLMLLSMKENNNMTSDEIQKILSLGNDL